MTIGASGYGSGFFTNGMAILSGSVLSGASSVACDTGYAQGANPQAGGIIPGTLPAPPGNIGITAHAGGTKAAAYQVDYGVTQIAVAATAADSILLPYAYPGAVCVVLNNGAASAQVFGKGTDTINAAATGTGVAQAAAGRAIYVGVTGSGDGSDAGTWQRILSA